MNKRILVAVLAPAFLGLAGCSSVGTNTQKSPFQYSNTDARANLEVPPGLAPLPQTNLYTMPTPGAQVSAQQMAAFENAAKELQAKEGHVLQQTMISHIVRDGEDRYLDVDLPPEKVWQAINDFLSQIGLGIAKSDPRTGYIQTAWQENRANLPQDPIRNTLGKFLDFAYSTGERDQYRIRLERDPKGGTDVFITHRSMVEVLVGKDKDSSRWEPGPTDPALAEELMRQLALRIENAYNPLVRKSLANAKDVPVQNVTPKTPPVKADVNKGLVSELIIDQPADRAWRILNYALDRIGFDVADRNRQDGYVLVNYIDSQYEADQKAKEGVFDRVFRSNAPINIPQFRIQLVPASSGGMRVAVLDKNGQPDTSGIGPRILTVLAEQMH